MGLNCYDTGAMKLSWSHKLFFQANRLVGRSAGFDAAIKFLAEYGIFLLILGALGQAWYLAPGIKTAVVLFAWLPGLWLVGFGLSALIGWLWPHRRPIVEFPEIKELITPLSNWKSMPSDHAFSAWLVVFITMQTWLASFSWVWLLPVGLMATLVCVARVLAGVHYPRDIIAGTVLAGVISILFFLV